MAIKLQKFKILSIFCAFLVQESVMKCLEDSNGAMIPYFCKYDFQCPPKHWCHTEIDDFFRNRCCDSDNNRNKCCDNKNNNECGNGKPRCQPQEIGTSAMFCQTDNKCNRPKRSDRKIRYCFDGVTPWENEPPCEIVDNIRFVCESHINDRRSRGTCRFGHCCPKRRVNMKKPILSYYSYRTNIDCDISIPLQPIYQYAFCAIHDETQQLFKIWLLGQKALETGEILGEKPQICRISADCSMNRVCVNLMHGVRICMFDTDHEMNPVNKAIPFYDTSKNYDIDY